MKVGGQDRIKLSLFRKETEVKRPVFSRRISFLDWSPVPQVRFPSLHGIGKCAPLSCVGDMPGSIRSVQSNPKKSSAPVVVNVSCQYS